MKKFLLFAIAALASVGCLSAQNYVAQGETYYDEEYSADGTQAVLLDNTVTVEAYDGYVILRGWMGSAVYDLKVAFDDEDNVTSLTTYKNGIEDTTYTSGYAATSTGNSQYYYAQIYLADGYNYAASDDEGGYVFLTGYFYKSSTEYEWCYYYLAWDNEGEELMYSTSAAPSALDGYGEAFTCDALIGVDAYPSSIVLKGWAGVQGYDLQLGFDAEAKVTSVTPIVNGEACATVTSGNVEVATGNAQYTNAVLNIADSYAYASASDGYVLLMGDFTVNGEQKHLQYYLEFDKDGNSISDIAADSAKAEYYTINGMRVDNPSAKGVYIVRKGAKASKTIIR